MSTVKTRFAPSPTGFMHVGGLRTALYNYLFAKQQNGLFLLRIEDTDKARIVQGAEKNIIETLRDFGLDFDGEPFYQSKNLKRYKECAEVLIGKKIAYKDDGAVRFRMPKEGITKFTDIIRGEIEMENNLQEDFVILKSDGYPTYNLAHLVDDHDMGITHVIRGEEFISSMPKYIALHNALGWKPPQYAHLPLLLNNKKAKLSKREGDVSVNEFLNLGYLKEAILNFVALLGWHPKTEQEIFTLEELINEFKLEDVQKAGAVFDMTKQDWMNGEYIRNKSSREIFELAKPWLGELLNNNPIYLDDNKIEQIIEIEQPRLKKLSEIGERVGFYFKLPGYDKTLLCWKNMTDAEIKYSLEKSQKIIISIKEFSKENLEKTFFTEIGEGDKGVLLWPLRTALTGLKNSPPPFEIMEILEKNETIERIKKALSLFS